MITKIHEQAEAAEDNNDGIHEGSHDEGYEFQIIDYESRESVARLA
jgi:hypothetical protein